MAPAPVSALSAGLVLPLLAALLLAVGMWWRARAALAEQEARAERMNRHHQGLYRELQHRVSNGIQAVASVLSLKASLAENAQTEDALRAASERLLGVAEVHRQLWDPGLAGPALAEALPRLVRRLLENAGLGHVALTLEAQAPALGHERSTTLAMILAEAVANSIRHAFAARGAGRLEVSLRPAPGQRLLLLVRDDGPGPSPGQGEDDEALLARGSLGMMIMRGLVDRLRGNLSLESAPGGGALLRVDFPVPD